MIAISSSNINGTPQFNAYAPLVLDSCAMLCVIIFLSVPKRCLFHCKPSFVEDFSAEAKCGHSVSCSHVAGTIPGKRKRQSLTSGRAAPKIL
jgi:hypothetical protein